MIRYLFLKNPRKNKLVFSILIFIFTFILVFSVETGDLLGEVKPYQLDYTDIVAESALVMDYDTSEILWEKNANRLMYPASITKIMTAIVAIEEIDDLQDEVIISENASGRNSSFFAFSEGDRITVYDLLKAAMINSQNNATVALAEYVSGNVKDFLVLMNEKAKEIGAISTNFENTNGLDSEYPLHRSTAGDIAIITRYAMQNEIFREIVKIREDYIKINDEDVYIFNTNKLLLYGHIGGVKTGFTNNAGHCIVTYSGKNDINLVTVVLNSDYGQREKDVLTLLRWAYVNFENKRVLDDDEVSSTITTSGITKTGIELYPEEDVSLFINRRTDDIEVDKEIDDNISLPVKKGDKAGEVKIYLNGDKLKDVDLVARSDYPDIMIEQDLEEDKKIFGNRWIFIFLIGFYFFVFIIIIIRNLIRPKEYK